MNFRPKDKEELQKREAIGIIRASRFVRKYAKSNKPINFDVVYKIHKTIFENAWPEIAGIFRIEEIEIIDSKLLPCHHSEIAKNIKIADFELSEKLKGLELAAGMLLNRNVLRRKAFNAIDNVVTVAAWLHHKVTYIHPFREGNGRTARLAANLILERFGLIGISIKMEKENKKIYRQALAQIDQREDYEPLKHLIFEGLIDRYRGVSLKYYEYKNKK